MQAGDWRVKLLAMVVAFCTGCSPARGTSAASTAEADTAPVAKALGPPATVAEAARIVDLAKLPLYPGATFGGRRRLGSLYYDVRVAFGDRCMWEDIRRPERLPRLDCVQDLSEI